MFCGIVEEAAKVVNLKKENENLHITMECSFVNELKVDQSVSHNGVCLTVVKITDKTFTVTAIYETLQKSNLGLLKIGSKVNLERSMKLNAMIDGHMVQGHVDQTAVCKNLTVVNSKDNSFQVAIIPYTYDITNFHEIKNGTVVNLEFDIIGKYITKIVKQQLESYFSKK
ncbi:MAG: riboflavin synthase [Bacteroidetes bacterium 4572_128]|nr:MAG: riboflavin synthase [Bacteroidetes bacterium 4572_128]